MNGKAAYTIVPPSPRVGTAEDEWGLFDPNQAGLKAAFRAAQSLGSQADEARSRANATSCPR